MFALSTGEKPVARAAPKARCEATPRGGRCGAGRCGTHDRPIDEAVTSGCLHVKHGKVHCGRSMCVCASCSEARVLLRGSEPHAGASCVLRASQSVCRARAARGTWTGRCPTWRPGSRPTWTAPQPTPGRSARRRCLPAAT